MSIRDFLPSPREGDHQLFRNVVRLKIEFGNPKNTGTAKTAATGFTLSIGSKSWIITNRHCIDPAFNGAAKRDLMIASLVAEFPGPDKGEKYYDWNCDLDSVEFRLCNTGDIAAIPMDSFKPAGKGGYATSNLSEGILARAGVFENIHVGDEAMFVGYPAKLWDAANHLPVLRTATISSIPSYDYGISGQPAEPRVLVNGMSLGGSSGSPVFYQTQKMGLIILGLMSGHYYSDGSGQWTSEIILDGSTVDETKTHTGLSYFIKSPSLFEIEKWPAYSRYGAK